MKKNVSKKAAAVAVDRTMLVRKDQVVMTKSHLSKLKNDLARAKGQTSSVADTVISTPTSFVGALQASMPGTTGAPFIPLFATAKGRVGVRNIGGGQFRVRVEPTKGTKLSFSTSWSTPQPNNVRYSTVVTGTEQLIAALQAAGSQLS